MVRITLICFFFLHLVTLVFLLMFQAALKNNGKDVVKELKREVTGYITSAMLVCQFAKTLATWVKTLYTKTLRALETSPQWFFLWAPVQTSNFLLPNLILQLSTRKRLTFESIKSDMSNLGRPCGMRTWEFRLRSGVDWLFMCRTLCKNYYNLFSLVNVVDYVLLENELSPTN